MNIRFKKNHPNAKIPIQKTEGSAGLDLCSIEDLTIYPSQRIKIKTGLSSEFPPEFQVLVRPRSGRASKEGLVLCTSGVIDSDYRGEWDVPMVNIGSEPIKIESGDAVAQFLVIPRPQIFVEEAYRLSETQRGTGGFGSTGK
jgi:dUTP pyrophosphatase